MADPIYAIQTAIYSALVSATPQIAGGRVYDHVPDAVEFPHVQIGEIQSIADDVEARTGWDVFVTVHIWSRYRGKKEAWGIANQIHSAVHAKAIPATDVDTAFCWVRDTQVFDDPDGATRHGVVTLRVSTHI